MSSSRDYTYMYMCCEVHDLHVAIILTAASIRMYMYTLSYLHCVLSCPSHISNVSPAKYYVLAIESWTNNYVCLYIMDFISTPDCWLCSDEGVRETISEDALLHVQTIHSLVCDTNRLKVYIYTYMYIYTLVREVS